MRTLLRSMFLVLSAILLWAGAASALPKVLILHANPADRADDVKAKLVASGRFAQVDEWDMDIYYGTAPTLADLKPYDAIITFTNYAPLAGATTAIEQYIDQGGGVVNGCFSITTDYNGGYTLELYDSPTYEALVPNVRTTGQAYLGTVSLPSHPIMAGVSTFDGGSSSFRSSSTSLEPGAFTIASWSDGIPLVVAKTNVGAKNAKIVDLNFFLASSDVAGHPNYWQSSTDGAKMMVNALLWVVPPPPSQLSSSPKSLDFGSAKVGDSVVRCGTISDVGLGTLKIQSFSISGATDFRIQSAPLSTDSVVAGSNSGFCISFHPIANGNRNALLTITTNGRDSGTQVISLTGIGTAPAIAASTAPIFNKTYVRLGDTTSYCIPVSSTGTGALSIDSVVFSGNQASSYFLISKPQPIPAGSSGSVCIGFASNYMGRTDAAVTIYSSAINKPAITIPLIGIGTLGRLSITPTLLNFDSVALGDKTCGSVLLSNTGNDTVRILNNYKTGGDYDFEFTPLTGSDLTIAPGQNVTFHVCFRPLRNGTRMATYAFRTNLPNTFESPRRDTGLFFLTVAGVGVPNGRLGFDGQVVDTSIVGVKYCSTDMVTNTGTTDFTITSAMVTGADSLDFSYSGVTLPLTLTPGASQPINVCFTPSARGNRAAMVTFVGTTGGKVQTINVPFVGLGLQQCASATPNSVFATKITPVGLSDSAIVTVTNCGDVATTYTPTVAGAGYTVTPVTSTLVAPNGTATFKVVYTPTAMGASAGTITFNGTPAITPQIVTLGGVGGQVVLAETGSDAGQVMTGNCANFNVTVQNNGNLDWTPGTGNVTGTDAADFSIVTSPATIAAGQSATVTVKFCPTTVGQKSASITYNAGSPIPFTLTLSGSGVVNGVQPEISQGYELDQSYPNPTAANADIRFVLPQAASVRLDIIDATGATVKTLVNGFFGQGEHVATLASSNLSSGTYFYVLTSGNVRLVKQMILTK